MTSRHPFHDLLPQHALPLRRRALKLTAHEHRAEDLVQTTLLKAWANRDKYTPDTQLRAWLFTILRNSFYSDLRKYRNEVEDVDGVLTGTLSEAPRQVHKIALEELLAAIASLPEIQRRPLILMGAYGYSQIEAAEACDCTVGTIKSRVSRARTSLCHALGHEPTVERGQEKRPRPATRSSMTRVPSLAPDMSDAGPAMSQVRTSPEIAMQDLSKVLQSAMPGELQAGGGGDLRKLVNFV